LREETAFTLGTVWVTGSESEEKPELTVEITLENVNEKLFFKVSSEGISSHQVNQSISADVILSLSGLCLAHKGCELIFGKAAFVVVEIFRVQLFAENCKGLEALKPAIVNRIFM